MVKLLKFIALFVVISFLYPFFPSSREGGSIKKQVEKIQGLASYYHPMFEGRCMANGLVFSQEDLVGASRTLPYGTLVRVWYGERNVMVTIMDNGPFVYVDEERTIIDERRVIDLSERAARTLGMLHDGLVPVTVEVLEKPSKDETYHHQNKQCLANA